MSERIAAVRAGVEADAEVLHDLQRIGLEAERIARDRGALVPPLEEFLAEVTRREPGAH